VSDTSLSAFQRAINKHKRGSKILSMLMSSNKFDGNIEPLLDRLENEPFLAPPLIERDQGSLLSTVMARINNVKSIKIDNDWYPNIPLVNQLVRTLEILLEQGADPNQPIKDNPKWTPLTLAIYEHKIGIAMMMVKSPQFVYTPHRGGTALMIAMGQGYAEECKNLIALLTEKKSNYEKECDNQKALLVAQKAEGDDDDDLWADPDDDFVIVEPVPSVRTPAPPPPGATTATHIITDLFGGGTRPVVDQENVDDELYKKNGIYEL
jgi:ankyrin repeat protein